MRRHFAFFSQHDGSWIREWADDVPAPRIPAFVNGSIRLALLDRWATKVSQPERGEVGLDVTGYGWPVGDFRWAQFDLVDRMLDLPEPHYWIEGDVVERRLVANAESPRPIRSHDTRLLLDVTGTPLQAMHDQLVDCEVRRIGDALVFRQLSLGREIGRLALPEPRTKTPEEVESIRLLGG